MDQWHASMANTIRLVSQLLITTHCICIIVQWDTFGPVLATCMQQFRKPSQYVCVDVGIVRCCWWYTVTTLHPHTAPHSVSFQSKNVIAQHHQITHFVTTYLLSCMHHHFPIQSENSRWAWFSGWQRVDNAFDVLRALALLIRKLEIRMGMQRMVSHSATNAILLTQNYITLLGSWCCSDESRLERRNSHAMWGAGMFDKY